MRFVFVLFTLLIAGTSATNVKQCSMGQPAPLSVEIEGCSELPCDVIKGSSAVMYVHFLGTKDNTYKITTKVKATALMITVPYDLPEDVADVCANLMYDARCPIYATEDVVYKFNFYVDNSYPEISVKVEVSLMDESNETIACFVANIKVKKGAVNPANLLE